MNTNATSLIETRWPFLAADGPPVPYNTLRADVQAALGQRGVRPQDFSHFGIVVKDARRTLVELAKQDPAWFGVEPVWGAAFECDIARQIIDGVEVELIQPVGDSFLRDGLQQHGEGVQHVSFTVGDLEGTLHKLMESDGKMVHPDIVRGLHGRIAFVRLPLPVRADVELCEEAGGFIG